MKRLTIFLFILLSFGSIVGQTNENLTYKVTNYSINNQNFDALALDGDVALSFYMCDNNTLCFANQWRNSNSQSYGGVYALQKKEIPETTTTHAAIESKFTWNFFNTYDSNRGTAAVTFTQILVGNTIKFTAEIVVIETNEILSFKGYLEN